MTRIFGVSAMGRERPPDANARSRYPATQLLDDLLLAEDFFNPEKSGKAPLSRGIGKGRGDLLLRRLRCRGEFVDLGRVGDPAERRVEILPADAFQHVRKPSI